MIDIKRSVKNPLITPQNVKPSRPDFVIECVFNAGVARYEDEVILLMRVAERPIQVNPDVLTVPVLKHDSEGYYVDVLDIDRNNPAYDFSDPRKVKQIDIDTYVYLTSMSHLRIARSKNGVDFVVEDEPFLFPNNRYEAFGAEDPRITFI